MNPLVSVIVATYNSSGFVAETLESVSAQSWKEIELIITDDCSYDDTIDICRSWIDENRQRFVKTAILTSEVNSGVPANVNQGLYAARGEWICFLAGDDTMKTDCIENNISWLRDNPEARVLFSSVDVYRGTIEASSLIRTTPQDPYNVNGIMSPVRTASSQYRMLLINDRIHFTPSLFLHRETLLEIGGFDERFKLLEDYPLWLNLTRNGHRLHFMDKVTVNYRQHSAAINNMQTEYLIKPNYFRTESFRKIYTYPNLPVDIRLSQRYIWLVSQVFRVNWLNRNSRLNRFLKSILTLYLNPFRYLIWFRKRFCKDLKNNEFYL